VFAPADDPEGGSLGVSFATADGVLAEVTPAAETDVTLDGEAATVDPVAYVLEEFGVTAQVDLKPAVPVGYGFGASGAATLATALAATEVFDIDSDRAALVDAAHRAEVRAGTGLGDVYVQDRGGLVWNTGDRIGRVELDARVEYDAIAGMDTAAVLGDGDRMDRIGRVGRTTLSTLDPSAGLAPLFERSWQFARETSLATDRVVETVDRVVAADGAATMAMIGETVVATGVDGVLEGTTRIGTAGARLVD
jgi:pantoate kinase